MRLVLACLLAVAAACGPKAGTTPSATRPGGDKPAGPKEPERPQPPAEPPFEVKAVHAFSSPDRCSQGPLDMEVAALGASPVERVTVVACTPREIAGRWEIGTPGWGTTSSSFGWDKRDNSRCAAKPGEVKATKATPAEPPTGSGRAKPGKAARKKTDERPPAPRPVSVPWTADRDCPHPTAVADTVYTRPRLPRAGQTLRVRLWSEVPNDLEGVIFVVKQLALGAKVAPAQWDEYQRRSDAYDKAYRSYLDKLPICGTEAAKGRSCVYGPDYGKGRPSAPPPSAPRQAKQPPRPSANAVWVPGYWHWAGAAWTYLAGWWRVPEADVEKNLTARAPAAPPAARPEAQAPAPGGGAVWIPGHWMWADGAWVWASGGWRLPPGPGYRWHPPEWRRVPSGFVFIPGRWVR